MRLQTGGAARVRDPSVQAHNGQNADSRFPAVIRELVNAAEL